MIKKITPLQLTRRRFLETVGFASACILLPNGLVNAESNLSRTIRELLGTDFKPGVAVGIVKDNKLSWSHGYGWANIEKQMMMTPDTIHNIASVSKTITATAVMQLQEAGKIDLNTNIDEYLGFAIRNPKFLDSIITCRQLLAHRSSVKDGSSYDRSYTCGDPVISLTDWVEGYLKPGGQFYNADENFHSWKPGTDDPPKEPRSYSNVGYGLLAHIVEKVSGFSFQEYTDKNIFNPLNMDSTGWSISKIDTSQHATPYTKMGESFEYSAEYPNSESYLPLNVKQGDKQKDGLFPHCLYSFPNYPDGLLRSNTLDMSRFLIAMMNNGQINGKRILKDRTIKTMLTNNHFGRGICWNSTTLGGKSSRIWYHNGSDPGVMTFCGFRPEDKQGLFMVSNSDDPGSVFSNIVRTVFTS